MPHQERLNIAVFIDFDNIEIGVKTTLGEQFDVGTILDAHQGARRGRHQDRLRRLDARRRVQPRADPARHPARAAQPDARRRQERRRHQPRARRARDGVHPPAHQRLRHRRRRQRLPVAGREAEAVRQEGVRRRRPRVHEHHPAAQLPRVHRLREPAGVRKPAAEQRAADAGAATAQRRRSRRRSRSCAAR